MYFEQLICQIQGQIDPDAFAAAWRHLIGRHQILRTAFVTKRKKEPVQVVFEQLPFAVQKFDWTLHDSAEQSRRLSEYLQNDRSTDFVLNRPPLMRVTLIKMAPDSWQLIWSHHHVLLDGWSLSLLMREFLLVYESFTRGLQPQLQPLQPFGEYLVWLQKQDRRKAEAFWRKTLGGFPGPNPLGIDHARVAGKPAIQQEHYRDSFTLQETRQIEQRARDHRVTLNVLFQAAWGLLLSSLCGEDDIVFGTTLSGRAAPVQDIEQMVGMFINTLPLRLRIRREEKLGDWLHEIQQRNIELQEHEHSALTDIHRWSGVGGSQPLFETLFVFENFPVETLSVDSSMGLKIIRAELLETTHLPLSMVVIPGTALKLKLSYDSNRILPHTAKQLLQDFRNLVLQVADSLDLQISALQRPVPSQVLSLEEKPDFSPTETLAQKFFKSSALHDSLIALSFGQDQWTYRRLADEAAGIAAYLARQGVRPETRVGICMERSPKQIVAMLGVIQAGGAYVPIDPGYPPARISFMIADSESPFLLTTGDLHSRLYDLAAGQSCKVLDIEDCSSQTGLPLPQSALSMDNAAYVIYTSGSTGTPKGMVITHRNVVRLFDACRRHFQFSSNDIWTYFHSFSFDFSVWEIWGALLHGAHVVIVPYLTARDPEQFYELLSQKQITVLSQTPSAFNQLICYRQSLEQAPDLSLRYVVLGGEAIELQSLKPWFDRYPADRPHVINMYGITETTVHVTYRRLTPEDIEQGSGSVIGRPLADLRIDLLDRYDCPVPQGVKGEICISGPGLGRGYLGRPELTSERFAPHPFSQTAGERIYRSGDIARRLSNGELIYCGRIDNQVKIRGHRIEIGEVTTALLQHQELSEIAVRVYINNAGETRLAAYVVCKKGRRVQVEPLRSFLRQSLPDYMLPQEFILCDYFPLTIHGKLDFDALPTPWENRAELEEKYEAPATDFERQLAEIWQDALGIPRVGRNDDFFALGGDSIRSITISSLARNIGIPLSVAQIFQYPTISAMAEALAEKQADVFPPKTGPYGLVQGADLINLPADLEDAYPIARLQAGMLFHSHYGDGVQRYEDTFSFRLQVQFDEPGWFSALESMLADHPILRTSFHFSDLQQPLQYVHRAANIPFAVFDLRDMLEEDQDRYRQKWLKEQLKISFNWEAPPLLRLFIHRLRDNVVHLTLIVHHAILDGWSVAVFLKELAERYLYLARLSGLRPQGAPESKYREYIAMELEALASEEQQKFWTTVLADAPNSKISRWPVSGVSRPATGSSGFLKCALPAPLSSNILGFAHQIRLPVKSILLTVHFRVLQRLTGSSDIITGLVSNGRPETGDSTRVLGLFLNTIPFRLKIPRCSWLALCKTVLSAETELLPYRRFPLAEISRLNGNVVPFECSFNFVNFHIYQALKDNRAISLLDTASFEQVDTPVSVNFSLDVADKNLSFGLMYDSSQFPDAQASSIASYYQRALEALVADPFMMHTSADLLSEEERSEVLHGINNTSHNLPSPFFVHKWVELRAAATPNAVAVSSGEQNWSYAELNVEATRLASLIIAKGGQPDTPIGLIAYRSFDMVYALLAILKAGCAYVPIDPDLPRNRINEILREVNTPVLLVDDLSHSHVPKTYAGEKVVLSELANYPDSSRGYTRGTEVHPLNLAYILFTSGSTGKPKGVAITHQGLSNHMQWMRETFPLASDDVVLQKTNYMFDASVWEFWAPLMAGAKLVLAMPGAHQDSAYLVQKIQTAKVTILQLVPSMLEVVLEEPDFSECRTLRRLFVGGEALKTSLSERFHERLRIPLINLYGPTEATIESSAAVILKSEPGSTANIGKPIFNSRYYVLDSESLPVPLGVPGELHIGGACLARSYWNSPDLTADRFIPDSFSGNGERLYRTGDLVRHLPGGKVDYLGRLDRQFKVRGFRIEMADIEAAFMALPGVRHCLANVRESADAAPRLMAYYQLLPEARFSSEEINLHLRENLPSYMVPAILRRVEEWPLLPNGKTDSAALFRLQLNAAESSTSVIAPSTETELILAEIWKRILRVERIGIEQNFFDLGGDSILSLQIVAQARKHGLRFTPRDLFNNPTIATLAQVTGKEESRLPSSFVMSGEVPLTPIQNFFFEQDFHNPHHWNQSVLLETSTDYSSSHIEQGLKHIIAQHDAFRLRFHKEANFWRQGYGDSGSSFAFEEVDLDGFEGRSGQEELEAHCNRAQSTLDLSKGPLIRCVFFRSGVKSRSKLLLVCHHLIIDGVSWRILLEDLAAYLIHQEIAPVSSLPFGAWARRLAQAPQHEILKRQKQFWLEQAARRSARLPVDHPGSVYQNTHASACTIRRELTVEETERLLTGAPRNLNASVEEVLLSALAQTVTNWTGSDNLLVHVEWHGREPFMDDMDLSRSIGWFTVLYPLSLELSRNGNDGSVLALVKRQLRALPNNGIGYGLLRYGSEDPSLSQTLAAGARPEISFNYLGQFDNTLPVNGPFRMAGEPAGYSCDPGNKRDHLLEVVAYAINRQLVLQWNYSSNAHYASTIDGLAEDFLAALKHFASQAREPNPSCWIAQDFPLATLTDAEFAQVLDEGTTFKELWPLSPVQEGMLFHTLEQGEAGGVYIQQLHGALGAEWDLSLLEQSWRLVLRECASLRAVFLWEGLKRPVQTIAGDLELPFAVLDWTCFSQSEQQELLERFLQEDRASGFDLRRGPLMRVTCIRISDQKFHFVWTHHHILLDGWSVPLLLAGIVQTYAALREGKPPVYTSPSYSRYLAWLLQQDYRAAEQFWRGYLSGYDEPQMLAQQNELEAGGSGLSTLEWCDLSLDEERSDRLKSFAHLHKITPSILIQAAWAFILSRILQNREVVFGVTVSGRPASLPAIEEMIGLFINTLPVRVKVHGQQQIGDWLTKLQGAQSELLNFQYARLIDIAGWSDIPRGQPLFDSILVFENYPVQESLRATGAKLSIEGLTIREQSHYPFTLYVGSGDILKFTCSFRKSAFSHLEPARLLSWLDQLISNLIQRRSSHVSDLGFISASEQIQILQAWNTPGRKSSSDLLLPARLRKAAGSFANKTAVQCGSDRMSYSELDDRANRLADYLRRAGAGPDFTVTILLEREIYMVVALLAVLHAGAAYLALDPEFPQEHLRAIIEESAPGIILTSSKLRDLLPGMSCPVVSLDTEWVEIMQREAKPLPAVVERQSLAYLIFTSGSTGKPKGVQITHRALMNILESFQSRPGLQSDDVFVAVTTISFDIAMLEIFLPLLVGATVVLAPRDVAANGFALAELIEQSHATAMQATPVTWRMLLAADWKPLPGFRVWCGGEMLPRELAGALLKRNVKLWNVYGPTETTIWSTVHEIENVQHASAIGRPVLNTQVYVLDDNGNLLPPDVPGELYIGGDGLARAYLNEPALTAEKLLPDPFSQNSGTRLYRTGDSARFTSSGILECLGRTDLQKKVDGFRIELEDVEASLSSIPGIQHAAAAVISDRNKINRLVAFLVYDPSQAPYETSALRKMMTGRVPAYMVPSSFTEMAALPLTANNKLDRKQLVNMARPATPKLALPPANAVEEVLVAIWKEAFEKSDIGIEDDFFDLGGHSLIATQIHAKIKKVFQSELALRQLFHSPTIRNLAAIIQQRERAPGLSDKIARLYLKVKRMSPAEREHLLVPGNPSR